MRTIIHAAHGQPYERWLIWSRVIWCSQQQHVRSTAG
jgi:hypothetical protein